MNASVASFSPRLIYNLIYNFDLQRFLTDGDFIFVTDFQERNQNVCDFVTVTVKRATCNFYCLLIHT